jgi:phage baseplate assembly protein W
MSSNSALYDKIKLPVSHKSQPISSQLYKGFSTVSASTENFGLYDLELIKQDILNHFHIRQGERLMLPTFGTIIWDLLFEPLTNQVKTMIIQNVTEIINYDPRVKAEGVIVTQYESGIQIECVLTYMPYNISQAMQYKFDQSNGLLSR